jgi:hypothetical protein
MADTAPERCSVRPKECQLFILSHLLPDRRNAWLTLTHGRIGNRVNELLT